MMNWIKKIVFLCITSTGILFSQSTKILSIDSIQVMDPVIMNGITNFSVSVRVDDTSAANNDFTTGILFYYYLTDSMIDAGVPPRIIAPNSNAVFINPIIVDTVPIDILPDEIKTDPVNLIILWPAISGFNTEVVDTDSAFIHVTVNGFLNTYQHASKKQELYYPLPAMQVLYIRPDELALIERIRIYSLNGNVIKDYSKEEFKSGQLDLYELSSGTYLVETEYTSGYKLNKKIIKR